MQCIFIMNQVHLLIKPITKASCKEGLGWMVQIQCTGLSNGRHELNPWVLHVVRFRHKSTLTFCKHIISEVGVLGYTTNDDNLHSNKGNIDIVSIIKIWQYCSLSLQHSNIVNGSTEHWLPPSIKLKVYLIFWSLLGLFVDFCKGVVADSPSIFEYNA